MNLDVFTSALDPTNPGHEVFDPENAWPGASSRVYIATYRSGPLGVYQYGYDPATGLGWVRTMPEPGAAWTPWYNSGNPPPPINIASLNPPSMIVGGAQQTLEVIGDGFTSASVIVFNGGDEKTTFVDANKVTTIVKPALASGPISLPIYVRNYQRPSNTVQFEFVEAEAERKVNR
jgi:hypothetical protein